MLTLYNAVDFPLRQLFSFSRGASNLVNEPKADLFANLPDLERLAAEKRLSELRGIFNLSELGKKSSVDLYRKNLYYLDLLENIFSAIDADLPANISAADVGSSHWFYVHALLAFLGQWNTVEGREVSLIGFEPDAYRVYRDFRSRYDHACAHMAGLSGVCYHPEEFSEQADAYDLITHFFPFIFLEDHLAWGLPRGKFSPGSLFQRSWRSLKPGGYLLVVNQGHRESQKAEVMLADLNPTRMESLVFSTPFFTYDLPSIVNLLQKPNDGGVTPAIEPDGRHE